MSSPDPARPNAGGDPWIESRRGGLFFVNALLIFPHVMVVVPLLTRILLRAAGRLREPSEIVDTFPALAEYLLPRVGWLLLLPVVLIVLNLRIEGGPWPRAFLLAFLVLHAAFLGWTLGVWFGVWPAELPGGP